ncbi:MAG: hypothetical protein EON98_13400 [Chitinophagaceae bacterium]|nr:MAG: hypothetical protein EON98_13400 [Chitinophagaceae bacterium]
MGRRLTPSGFYQKNDNALAVVNGTFFSFETNRNLNVLIKNGELLSYNTPFVQQKKGDSVVQIPVYRSAIGINKKRKADVAWIKTNSNWRRPGAHLSWRGICDQRL